jgi:hypothetical protein
MTNLILSALLSVLPVHADAGTPAPAPAPAPEVSDYYAVILSARADRWPTQVLIGRASSEGGIVHAEKCASGFASEGLLHVSCGTHHITPYAFGGLMNLDFAPGRASAFSLVTPDGKIQRLTCVRSQANPAAPVVCN